MNIVDFVILQKSTRILILGWYYYYSKFSLSKFPETMFRRAAKFNKRYLNNLKHWI